LDPLSECFAPAEPGPNFGEIRSHPLVVPLVDVRQLAEGVLVDRPLALLARHESRSREMLDRVAVRAERKQPDHLLTRRPGGFVVLVALVDLNWVPLADATQISQRLPAASQTR
jgi:hypothetical protein